MTAAVVGETSAAAEVSEKELLSALALKESTYADIDVLIAKYRTACEVVLFEDFVAAAAKNTEIRLWNAHGKINNKYRSGLAKFRDGEGKKKPVERRTLEKRYLDFIKSSMRFYRGYIQHLVSHFKSPKEILEIAHKLHLDTLSVDPVIEPSRRETQLILDSCHATLVRLGDLSRYRETELQTKERNWAPAVGYYDLATAVKPASGASHNQLAVIALADSNHLRALYHLYRAMSAPAPYPRARENLETEFKKILDRKKKNLLFPESPEHNPGVVLQAWFVYLHARLHAGVSFPEHEELENEVLMTLSLELKEHPLDGLLQKITLSNITAQHLVSIQAAEVDKNGLQGQAFTFFLRFNVETFSTLLQILFRELEQVAGGEDDFGNVPSSKDISDKISATARRILPCLRHYSSWLVSNASHLVALEDHDFVGIQVRGFWRTYADALTLLAAIFSKSDLPNVEYLLGEDEDTIAFTPFAHPSTSRRYFQTDRPTQRPRSSDQGVQRHHPSVEMLFRIRGLLEDGIALAAEEDGTINASVPLIVVDDFRFVFREDGLPPEPSYSKSHAHSRSSASINRADIKRAKHGGKSLRSSTDISKDESESVAPSVSTNTATHRMVSGVLASDISDSHEPRPHFPQISHGQSPPTPTALELDDGAYEGSQSVLGATARPQTDNPEPFCPSLPSIFNSPFAPRPGEAAHSLHPHPDTAHKYPVASTNTSTSTPTPAPLSSNIRFQAALLRQQQDLEMQQSPIYDLPPTASLSHHPASSIQNNTFLRGEISPIPSPFTSSASGVPLATFPSTDVPRPVPEQSRFGAVGQIPPSGQGGGGM